MKYVYAKLSKIELLGVRLGGAGLGNLLFIYAESLVYAQKNKAQLIWPTWPSLKIGPYMRRERDKRFYNDLFTNYSSYMDGIRKLIILLTKQKIHSTTLEKVASLEDKVVIFDTYKGSFENIREESKLIKEDLIRNLCLKNRRALEYDFSHSVNIHIRLGDFTKADYQRLRNGAENVSIPLEWYKHIIEEVRQILGYVIQINVFSDGTDEELKEILDMPNVMRLSFGTSIADIIALSQSKLFICSGSTFSMWARYLGRTCTIAYPGQLKEAILLPQEEGFEVEIDEEEKLPGPIKEAVIKLYSTN